MPDLQQAKNTRWTYAMGVLYIALNAFFIANDIPFLILLPVFLFVIFLALLSLDKLLLLIAFCTPLSIHLNLTNSGLGMNLPTEPVLFGIMILFIVRQLYEKGFDKKVMTHPITIAIIINLIWIFITSITSELPIVSFKFLLSRLWFVICFYFLGTQLFKDYKNIKLFNWLYILPLTIVIAYTLHRHYLLNFAEGPANWVVEPFYNDHTIYGAMLAMFFPILIFNFFSSGNTPIVRIFSVIFLFIFFVALVFSYTRAAWLSLFVALGVYLLFILKIKFKTVLIAGATMAMIFLVFQNDIMLAMQRNRQGSSDDFSKHLKSMSNISSDASNLERLNRWSAAFRMFRERPIVGWGPGTYSFIYAPFQSSNEKTVISTNAGNRGNAHSEYIGPLSESGIFGTISFLIIVISVIYTGAKLYYTLQNKEMKIYSLVILLGLITYFVHGGINNFLDTDKASVPFWGFIAMLVALDVYQQKKEIKN